jgi:hypothetical protein
MVKQRKYKFKIGDKVRFKKYKRDKLNETDKYIKEGIVYDRRIFEGIPVLELEDVKYISGCYLKKKKRNVWEDEFELYKITNPIYEVW